MAFAFVTSPSFVDSNMIGATTLTQPQEPISTPDAMLKDIEQLHLTYPNPCP